MTTTFLTSEQVQGALIRMKEEHGKNTAYRMENYFNCVDDYSWGGICDQAQNRSEQALSMVLGLLKEQEENGGFLITKVTELELRNTDGSFVSSNIINGKYGACFMWGSEQNGFQFCGLAKKQSTFEKKGFVVVAKNYELKVRYTGKVTKGGYADRVVELVSTSETIENTIDISIDNRSYDLFKLKSA